MTITLDSYETYDVNGNLPAFSASEGRMSILGRAYVVLKYSCDVPLNDGELYFHPAMFLGASQGFLGSSIPPSGWYYKFPTTIAASSGNLMTVYGLGSHANQRDSDEVTITLVDDNNFEIVHRFRLVHDEGDFVNSTIKPSLNQVLKNHIQNPNLLDNNFTSVYKNDNRFYKARVHFIDSSSFYDYDDVAINYYAGFYGKSFNDNPEQLTDLTYTQIRNATAVTNLSVFDKTDFEVTVDANANEAADEAYIVIFRNSNGTNGQPVPTDLDFTEAQLTDDASTTQILGKLYGPTLKPYNSSGTLWTLNFSIAGAELTAGESYYIALVWLIKGEGANPDSYLYETKLLGPFLADGDPEPLAISITSIFQDYHKTESTDKPYYAPAQRHRVSFSTSKTGYNLLASLAGSPFTDFLTDLVSIDFLVLRTDVPLPQIYTIPIRQIFKSGTNWVSNDGKLSVVQTASTFFILYDFRTMYGGQFATWTSEIIRFRTVWTFDYTPQLPGFIVRYGYEDEIQVKNFDNGTDKLEYLEFFDAETGLPLRDLCNGQDILVVAKLLDTVAEPETYTLQAMVDKDPFGTSLDTEGNLKEHETEPSTTPGIAMTMLTENIMYDVEAKFDATTRQAKFKVKGSMILPNIQYRIFAGAVSNPI